MYCSVCYEDINEKGQDNMSLVVGKPLCEDCFECMSEDDIDKLQECYDLD